LQITELLKEISKWQKFIALPHLKDLITKTLDKKEKLIVYELTDGEKNRDELIKESGAAAGTISGWWMEWYSKGILEKVRGKYKKIISLEDLGIKVPKRVNEILNSNGGTEIGETTKESSQN